MEKDELIELLVDSFEGAKEPYSSREIDKLHEDIFYQLTHSQGDQLIGMMLMYHTHRSTLPPGRTWKKLWQEKRKEFFEDHPGEYETESCNQCHNGWRYIQQSRTMVGQQVIQRCVARCTCAAGKRLSARVPMISHIGKRGDFVDEVHPSTTEAYSWPKKELGTGGGPGAPAAVKAK